MHNRRLKPETKSNHGRGNSQKRNKNINKKKKIENVSSIAKKFGK